jgi:hypothetical protein
MAGFAPLMKRPGAAKAAPMIQRQCEAVLADAPLADCAIEYGGDQGRVRAGVAGGVPFDDDLP